MPYLGIQVEPVDLSIRPSGQLIRQLPGPPVRADRRLWILPLAAKPESAPDTKVRSTMYAFCINQANKIKRRTNNCMNIYTFFLFSSVLHAV